MAFDDPMGFRPYIFEIGELVLVVDSGNVTTMGRVVKQECIRSIGESIARNFYMIQTEDGDTSIGERRLVRVSEVRAALAKIGPRFSEKN